MVCRVKNLGQVYTPSFIVEVMLSLRKYTGSVLEPSSGDGAFSKVENIVSIEIDHTNKKDDNIIMDFFDYPIIKYDTIISNPPYVAYKNIIEQTLNSIRKIDYLDYDEKTNLYVFFIRKCFEHLTVNGEMIFITPREFIKATSARHLNKLLYDNGTITHWYEFSDKNIFKGYSPSVVVWRYEKNDMSHKTNTHNGMKTFNYNDGQISFVNNTIKFSDLFFVKVGGVSGMDKIFANENGNKDFVCSYTKANGNLKRFFYNINNEFLYNNKEVLKTRKLKTFSDDNYWLWGRDYYHTDSERIYVNCKTRDMQPFFTHECKDYDGSVLAIFPKIEMDINIAVDLLNSVNWNDLGFKVGGRLCFSQKALQNCYLPQTFDILC